MKRYLYLFTATLFLFLTASNGDAKSLFAGAETDSDGQSYVVVGGSSGGERFLQVVAEAFDYEIDDNGVDRNARVRQVTIAGGIELGGDMNVSVSAGPTFWKKKEGTSFGTADDNDVGITVRVSGDKALEDAPVDAVDFTASFTTLDSFFLARVRGKTGRYEPYTVGAEAFVMANDDTSGFGAGPYAEFDIDIGTLIVRAGLKHTSTSDSGIYGGFEFSKTF